MSLTNTNVLGLFNFHGRGDDVHFFLLFIVVILIVVVAVLFIRFRDQFRCFVIGGSFTIADLGLLVPVEMRAARLEEEHFTVALDVSAWTEGEGKELIGVDHAWIGHGFLAVETIGGASITNADVVLLVVRGGQWSAFSFGAARFLHAGVDGRFTSITGPVLTARAFEGGVRCHVALAIVQTRFLLFASVDRRNGAIARFRFVVVFAALWTGEDFVVEFVSALEVFRLLVGIGDGRQRTSANARRRH